MTNDDLIPHAPDAEEWCPYCEALDSEPHADDCALGDFLSAIFGDVIGEDE